MENLNTESETYGVCEEGSVPDSRDKLGGSDGGAEHGLQHAALPLQPLALVPVFHLMCLQSSGGASAVEVISQD